MGRIALWIAALLVLAAGAGATYEAMARRPDVVVRAVREVVEAVRQGDSSRSR